MNWFRIEKEGELFLFREISTGNIFWRLNPEAGRIISYLPGEGNVAWLMNDQGDTMVYDVVAQQQTSFYPAKKLAPQVPPPQSFGVKVVVNSGKSASWFGGRPKLPKHIEWPRSGDHSYLFIGQIDCTELPSAIWGGIGPRSGWLAIFASHHERLDAKVIHFSDPGQKNVRPEDVFNENMMYERIGEEPPCASVEFVKWNEVPDKPVANIKGGMIFGRKKSQSETSQDIARIDIEPAYYTSGYPGGDSKLAAFMEVPTNEFFGWQWGDVDNLMILIGRQALAQNDFSDLRCELTSDKS